MKPALSGRGQQAMDGTPCWVTRGTPLSQGQRLLAALTLTITSGSKLGAFDGGVGRRAFWSGFAPTPRNLAFNSISQRDHAYRCLRGVKSVHLFHGNISNWVCFTIPFRHFSIFPSIKICKWPVPLRSSDRSQTKLDEESGKIWR